MKSLNCMKIVLISLSYCWVLSTAADSQALEIRPQIASDNLPLNGATALNLSGPLPSYWVLEKEIAVSDARALNFLINAPTGTKAWIEIVATGGSPRIGGKKKRKPSRRPSRRSFSKSPWFLDLLDSQGKVAKHMQVKAEDGLLKSSMAFLFPDACNPRSRYLIRAVLDFRELDITNAESNSYFSAYSPYIEFQISEPPRSQATLFKFPSEKDPSSAVILMQTSGVNPEYIHFTANKNGRSVNLATFAVDQYFFSGSGLFTRLYLGGSYLNGSRVSMHHISPDLSAIYSVCAVLSRKRQELEGYR